MANKNKYGQKLNPSTNRDLDNKRSLTKPFRKPSRRRTRLENAMDGFMCVYEKVLLNSSCRHSPNNTNTLKSWIKTTILASYLIATTGLAEVTHLDFISPMGEEKWRMTGSPLRCGLSLTVPNYGVGYFEQYATKNPHFILRTWDQVQRPLPTLVMASPPVWKVGRDYIVAKSFIKPGEFGLFLPRIPALKLLAFLSQGYEANVNYRNEQGFTTTVILTPIRFQKAYAKYQRCIGSLLPFNYNDIKESIFHFASDSRMINEEDKMQLRRIAQYVAADRQVDVVRVVGYADDSGRKGYNNAISQFRAEAIQQYLLSLGVPKTKLSVTWVGAQYPVARNDTDEGRAANRRVVVNVFKK